MVAVTGAADDGAGLDSDLDSGLDSGFDAGLDSGLDAGLDAGAALDVCALDAGSLAGTPLTSRFTCCTEDGATDALRRRSITLSNVVHADAPIAVRHTASAM